jgi:hypothetical protein
MTTTGGTLVTDWAGVPGSLGLETDDPKTEAIASRKLENMDVIEGWA